MQFDKPKVIIDLEEYQYLKEVEAKSKNEGFYTVARMALYAVIRFRGDHRSMSEYLKQGGVTFSYMNSATHADDFEMISINYEPPKK